jgi:hypothetical protein
MDIVDRAGYDGMVGRPSLGSNTIGSSGFLKRGLKPSRYLDTRADQHSPQSQVDF